MPIEDLVKAMNKKGGAKVTFLSDDDSPCIVHETMSTGCLSLDAILGGGLPVGRITEIYGDKSTGKSLIAAYVAAIAQEEGHAVLYIDTESAVSIDMVKAIGVDVDSIMYAVPDTLDGKEGVFQLIEDTIEAKKKEYPDGILLVIWDSIAASSALRELEADYGKAMMGLHAQLISQGLRKLATIISKERVCALFLNQTRKKIGVMFGDDTATFGGKAVEFYASIQVELKRRGKIKNGKRIIGENIEARTVKNKVAMPFQSAMLPVYFGIGIDDSGAAFEYLKDQEVIIAPSKGWYELPGIIDDKFRKADWDKHFDEKYEQISIHILEELGGKTGR